MGRKAALVALAAVCAIAVAQDTGQPQAAPRTALAELRSLRTMQALHIGREQAGAILSALADVSKRQDDFGVWATAQSEAALNTAAAAGAALSRRQLPPAPLVGQARDILGARLRHVQGIYQAADAAAQQIVKLATIPALIVEPRDAAGRTSDMEVRYKGARSAAEYVVDEAEALRMLEDNDYRLMRRVEAQRIAERIMGQGQAADQFSVPVINALDSLRRLPDQDFESGRAVLIQQVARNLNVVGPGATAPALTWREFTDWVVAPETAKMLAVTAGVTAPKITPAPPAVVDALADLRMMMLFLDLQLGPEQAVALGQLLAAVGVDKTAVGAQADQAEIDAGNVLPRIVNAMAQGQTVGADVADGVQKALAGGDASKAMMRAAMTIHVTGFKRILTPAQRNMVDWAPSEAADKLPAEERSRVLEQQAGVIGEGLDELNTVKFAEGLRYKTLVVSFSRDVVARYIDPRRPDFNDAVSFARQLALEARHVKIADWNGGDDLLFAIRLMRGLGALEDEAGGTQGRALYVWDEIYDILMGTADTPLATALGG